MASSSSSSLPRTWRYNVFVSFHGPDVRNGFLSHLSWHFKENGITMFYDQEIERGQIITPALIEAIRGSRIAILILSKKYASSGWCLDELLEIMKCKKAIGQIVMTIFYGVEPSDVRHQRGEFGIAFNETCVGKTEEKKRRWSQALNDAAIIAGEDFKNCDNEAERISKIVKDISNKLNATPSRDFDGMVGVEAHLRKMESLLHLRENLDATPSMVVGVCGPTGIGKSTIARALHSRHSSKFQLSCFVDNLRENYHGVRDEYSLKLILQAELLSKVLNLKDITIGHLGVLQERLGNLRVLIILDDVKNVTQLEALANESTWFGPGSRIVITTENKELLQQHNINNTYHVRFPSDSQALEILCRYAFMQSYPRNGFEKLAKRVVELCGKLPLGLRVVGSSLRGKNEEQWEGTIRRLGTIFDQKDIEEVLRVGYESLHENEKSLFVHIAIFNFDDCVIVEHLLADNKNNLEIKHGLEILANKSLIYFSTGGKIMMHKLLQQVGRNVVRREEPWKRKVLVDAQDILDVLEDEDDRESRQVTSILFDITGIKEVFINEKAFKRMNKLRFLKVINGNDTTLRIHEELELPRRLRFFHWEAYPGKTFPSKFNMEYIVELNMQHNKLEKLWEGAMPLTNLKKMNLVGSLHLKELPNLSNATNLERLSLDNCFSLEEIPSSIGNLQKLKSLTMHFCLNLQVVATHLNLASLKIVGMRGCFQLRKFPDIFKNVTNLFVGDTMLQDFPESVRLSSRLQILDIYKDDSEFLLDREQVEIKDQRENIEKLPDWIKDLYGLQELKIDGFPKLASLPEELPASLTILKVVNCESLETLMPFPSDSAIEEIFLYNCLKLGEEAWRVTTQQSTNSCIVHGRNVPAEFEHRTIGNSLTIPSGTDGSIRVCGVLSPKRGTEKEPADLLCRKSCNGLPFEETTLIRDIPKLESEHLFIIRFTLPKKSRSELLMEFSSTSKNLEIIECGFQIIMNKTSRALEQHLDINVTELSITDAMLEDMLECVSLWSHLRKLCISGSSCGRPFQEERWLIRGQDIEKISDCFKDLHGLQTLLIVGCPKLASLPELPASLTSLFVFDCDSLETLTPFSPESKIKCLYFSNCLKLGEEARRVITQQSTDVCLIPGRNVPAEFEHGATGNSLTIPIGTDSGYRVCVVLSPKQKMEESAYLTIPILCRQSCNGFTIEEEMLDLKIPKLETEHLFIIRFTLPYKSESELLMEFSTTSKNLDIIECGFQILTDKTNRRLKWQERPLKETSNIYTAAGNSLTIPSGTVGELRGCLLLSPKQGMEASVDILLRQSYNGIVIKEMTVFHSMPKIETEHLVTRCFTLPYKLKRELVMEFSTTSKNLDIIECSFQILTDKINRRLKWKERPLWQQDINMNETSSRYDVKGETCEV